MADKHFINMTTIASMPFRPGLYGILILTKGKLVLSFGLLLQWRRQGMADVSPHQSEKCNIL